MSNGNTDVENKDKQDNGSAENVNSDAAKQVKTEEKAGETKAKSEEKGKETKVKTKEKSKVKARAKKNSAMFKVLVAVGIVLVLVLGIAIAYVVHLYNLMNYDDGSNPTSSISQDDVSYEVVENPEDIAHLPTITIQTTEPHEVEEKKEGRRVEGVYNILLLGLDKAQGNLSDTIMIATLDTRDNSIKLTSVMRDILVQIPGYSPNKLNVPFKLGGISLLYQVLENYFEIKFDGYISINYYALEDAVDALGGVSLYISNTEADFLNTSNYISDEDSRNLVGGKTQKVNGSQFVGYCRQRSTTADADFGRTKRQRYALNAMYEKFRGSSVSQARNLIETVLPYVTTDLKLTDMVTLATNAISSGLGDIKQLRIPKNDACVDAQYKNMQVLDVDFEKSKVALHEFIFGDYIGE